jgi:hypothetical protein
VRCTVRMSAPWRASPEDEMESWVSFRDGERERARFVSAPLGGEALRFDIEDVTGEVTGERGRAGPGSSLVERWRGRAGLRFLVDHSVYSGSGRSGSSRERHISLCVFIDKDYKTVIKRTIRDHRRWLRDNYEAMRPHNRCSVARGRHSQLSTWAFSKRPG